MPGLERYFIDKNQKLLTDLVFLKIWFYYYNWLR